MYTSYFGFKEYPFNLTPDPKYLFLSAHHKQALEHLLYGINEKKGFIAITGGIGTGKTTLCRAFLSHLNASTKTALIFNSFVSDDELLRVVNQEFGMETASGTGSKKEHIDTLNRFLLETFRNGGNAVLLIDEAQNLSRSVLEQIRMLSNLETEKEKLIQIVLVGQPELNDLLASPSLKQLDERITVRYDLQPLTYHDIKGYVDHRLVVAGGKGDVKFTKGALKKIFAYSEGNPRRINAVCDRALLIAYAMEKHTITARMVSKAVKEIRGTVDTVTRANRQKIRWAWGLLTVVLIGGAAFVGWFYQNQEILKGPVAPVSGAVKTAPLPRKPLKPEKKGTALIHDDPSSLTQLFRISNPGKNGDGIFSGKENLELVTWRINPECYDLLKRPFRMKYAPGASPAIPSDGYILVREMTDNGAVVIDTEGRETHVPTDFILKNCESKISWFYPYSHARKNLVKGMHSSEIFTVQNVLHRNGYPVAVTGLFDETMYREIKKLQKDFGLIPDGIIGPRTMALLYLMG